MSDLALQSLQWSNLANIDDVRPIGAEDAECLEEIRHVLEKHGCLRRFGISLLHSHFALADDEILLETTNVSAREHWVRPVKKALLEEKNLTTQTTVVCFDEKGYSQQCGCCRDKHGHTSRHCT